MALEIPLFKSLRETERETEEVRRENLRLTTLSLM